MKDKETRFICNNFEYKREMFDCEYICEKCQSKWFTKSYNYCPECGRKIVYVEGENKINYNYLECQ